jgi:hypothetical protein
MVVCAGAVSFVFGNARSLVAAPEHEPKPRGNSPPGTFLAELRNFKKFVGFSGLLDIIW